jgi:hypothetical protein
MVKGPENKAYSMLDYINAAQNVNVVHRMKIQFIIQWNVHYTKTKDIVFLEIKRSPQKYRNIILWKR